MVSLAAQIGIAIAIFMTVIGIILGIVLSARRSSGTTLTGGPATTEATDDETTGGFATPNPTAVAAPPMQCVLGTENYVLGNVSGAGPELVSGKVVGGPGDDKATAGQNCMTLCAGTTNCGGFNYACMDASDGQGFQWRCDLFRHGNMPKGTSDTSDASSLLTQAGHGTCPKRG